MAKYQLLLPKMGESVAEATIIKWLKKPGDDIEADDAVMDIATDKVDSEVPSPVAGKLIEQLCKEDEVVQVGTVIAIIETVEAGSKPTPDATKPAEAAHPFVAPQAPVTAPEPQPAAPVYTTPAPAPVAAQAPQLVADAQPQAQAPVQKAPEIAAPPIAPEPDYTPPGVEQLKQSAPVSVANNSIKFYSPLVRSIAAQENIGSAELDNIPGTGAEGRLTKDDLLGYLKDRHKAPVTPVPQPVAALLPSANGQANQQDAPQPKPESVAETAPQQATTEPQPDKPAATKAETAAPAAIPMTNKPSATSASISGGACGPFL